MNAHFKSAQAGRAICNWLTVQLLGFERNESIRSVLAPDMPSSSSAYAAEGRVTPASGGHAGYRIAANRKRGHGNRGLGYCKGRVTQAKQYAAQPCPQVVLICGDNQAILALLRVRRVTQQSQSIETIDC